MSSLLNDGSQQSRVHNILQIAGLVYFTACSNYTGTSKTIVYSVPIIELNAEETVCGYKAC